MMDAVKFLKEQARMCSSFHSYCRNCPLCAANCDNVEDVTSIDKKIAIVEKWSKEHPAKTRLSEFLNHYPNALKREDGLPAICPCNIEPEYYERECSSKELCSECRKKYWLEEIE